MPQSSSPLSAVQSAFDNAVIAMHSNNGNAMQALGAFLAEAKNANVDVTRITDNRFGMNILHWAVRYSYFNVIQKLLASNFPVNVATPSGTTALHLAKTGHIAKLLLRRGADIEARDCIGNIPLHIAAQQNNYDNKDIQTSYYYLVVELLMAGSAINQTNNNGETPLLCAAKGGNLQIFKKLINISKQINVKDKNGASPLHLAAWHGNKTVVELLLKTGTAIGAVDNAKRTALHLIAMNGANKDIATLLLQKGGKQIINTRDIYGKTALDYAVNNNNATDIEFILRQYGADISNYKLTIRPHKRIRDEVTKANKDNSKWQGHHETNAWKILERGHSLSPFQAIIAIIKYQHPDHTGSAYHYFNSPQKPLSLTRPLLEKGQPFPKWGEIPKNHIFAKPKFLDQYQEAKKDPLLKELLTFAGFAAQGIGNLPNPKGKPEKHLQIKMAATPDVSGIKGKKDSLGLYCRNTILAGANLPIEEQWEILIHELAHYMMMSVFSNGCKPYKSNDTAATQKFDGIVTNLKPKFSFYKQPQDKDSIAHNIIADTFCSYPQDKYISELIVRVPQILAMLGNKDGMAWLQKNTPELLEFYEKHVQPQVTMYNWECSLALEAKREPWAKDVVAKELTKNLPAVEASKIALNKGKAIDDRSINWGARPKGTTTQVSASKVEPKPQNLNQPCSFVARNIGSQQNLKGRGTLV